MADPADGRRRIAPLSPFEEQAGFTRAIRVGERILTSGTIGIEADGSLSPEAGRQAARCFEQIIAHVTELGGSAGDVVRVRMFVTDMADADAVTAAFAQALGEARPAATLVAVSALYDPTWKCEIEAEAAVSGHQS